MKGASIDAYAGRWGVSKENLIEISQEDWERLQDFQKRVTGSKVVRLDSDGIHWTGHEGERMEAGVISLTSDIGGNTWNTAHAVYQVLNAVDSSTAKERIRFHSFAGQELADHLPPFHTASRELCRGFKMRITYVVKGPNGDDPLYWSTPPKPEETGPLPDVPNVLISSGGVDIIEEIKAYHDRNPGGKVFLAPGSRLVEVGIPGGVLEKIHFLSCNRREAIMLAQHLNKQAEKSHWTEERLVGLFKVAGLKELRITDGSKGVHCLTEGEYCHIPGFDRRDEAIQTVVRWLSEANITTNRTSNHPNTNGCEDTRLGVELSLWIAGVSFKKRMEAANFFGALQTFNPRPNLSNYPLEIIHPIVYFFSAERPYCVEASTFWMDTIGSFSSQRCT